MVESVLLLSGGIDSTALAYSLEPDLAITVDYGQICADAEVQAATKIADELDLEHHIIEVDCRELGTGSLAGEEQLDSASTPEWWPFRNQLIITMAATEALRRDANEIISGSVESDQQHADGRKEFYEKMDALLSFQEGSLNISAPAIEQTSEELVEESEAPRSLLGWTHSCHESGTACGQCRGCMKRHRVLDTVFR